MSTCFTRESIKNEKNHFSISENLPILITSERFLKDALYDGDQNPFDVVCAEDVINFVIFVLAVNDKLGISIVVPAAIAEKLLWNNEAVDDLDISATTILEILKNGDDRALDSLLDSALEKITDAYSA